MTIYGLAYSNLNVPYRLRELLNVLKVLKIDNSCIIGNQRIIDLYTDLKSLCKNNVEKKIELQDKCLKYMTHSFYNNLVCENGLFTKFYKQGYKMNIAFPFIFLDVDYQDISKIVNKITHLKSTHKLLFATGMEEELLFGKGLAQVSETIENSKCKNEYTFSLEIRGVNRKFDMNKKNQLRESMLTEDRLSLPTGKVCLTKPDLELECFYLYTFDEHGHEFNFIILTEKMGDGVGIDAKFALKNRKFISNTSMDPSLSNIMCNFGLVAKGDIVCDPFQGSGGILVAAAYNGSYVMGSEINWNLLHGRGKSSRKDQQWRYKDENLFINLCNYELKDKYLDCFVCDIYDIDVWRSVAFQELFNRLDKNVYKINKNEIIVSVPLIKMAEILDLINSCFSKQNYYYDAIITDPPYGLRESIKSFKIEKIFLQLVDYAARFLKLDGRLVFWMPFDVHLYNENCLPKHSCFKLVSNTYQSFTPNRGRRLLVYEKCQVYKPIFSHHIQKENFVDLFFKIPLAYYVDEPYQTKTYRESAIEELSDITNKYEKLQKESIN
ncbi:tRNA (guanine(10)-N2)-methyltransferase [Intoshia linei]|uniref:tRNA (guanine(10)-N(2))-methyltransferase TRMT11 n=1 Tax=Intoshia linei TaxID=1819745 RepID=A0A177ASM8_9BILA|nr:tRNA (guanine(10)-N2)-methyltransferase [Intoshia linei]